MSVQPWNVKIYVATWNVGSKDLDDLDLHNLLGLENIPENDLYRPDFYIIGLQEIDKDLFNGNQWTHKFKELLKIRGYAVVKTEKLQGLVLILFAQREHLLHIRQVETENERTGLGGGWGNKGAVCIRFSLYGSSVCIVNAHLAAHDHKLEDRIDDFEEIVQESNFHIKTTLDIFSHDYVIWFGDLNFRLTGEATPEHIRNLIQADKLEELIAKDELTLIRQWGRAFTELKERTPTFPPTFKFKKGTSEYDLKRRPAWTDRILYKEPKNTELSVEQTSYKSHPGYTISDHKPVTGEFTFKVFKNVNEEIVDFLPINIWHIGYDNVIRYTLPSGFKEDENDWIGVYKEDFTCLKECIASEYTTRSKAENGKVPRDKTFYNLVFPDDIKLLDDERYVLLYFQSSARFGIRRVTSLVGMSDVFKAVKRSGGITLRGIGLPKRHLSSDVPI